MKQFKILSLLALILLLFSCNGIAQEDKSKASTSTTKIEVIDFHSTHRCMTCNAIEANTKYTLETYFDKEIKEGKITFQAINVDDEKNYSVAEKFEASGTALFLNVITDGKETQIDLTNFAFMKGKEQDSFSKELKDKIETELKKL